jgi:hypothetical protein
MSPLCQSQLGKGISLFSLQTNNNIGIKITGFDICLCFCLFHSLFSFFHQKHNEKEEERVGAYILLNRYRSLL